MTLEYLEITQQDLQREFHLARTHPRHWVPSPTVSSTAPPRADLASLINSLKAAQHVLEMFRRSLTEDSPRRLLARLARRDGVLQCRPDATNNTVRPRCRDNNKRPVRGAVGGRRERIRSTS